MSDQEADKDTERRSMQGLVVLLSLGLAAIFGAIVWVAR